MVERVSFLPKYYVCIRRACSCVHVTAKARLIFVLYLYKQLLQHFHGNTGCIKKKLNKPEIAHRLCKAPQCTKFFIEIGCLGTDNVV